MQRPNAENSASAVRPPRWVASVAVVAFLAFAVVGIWLSWPLISGFGSTPAEQHAAYPADAPNAPAAYSATWATTVNAPPAKVWPWIVQMGADRAAFYSYDWAENLTAVNYHNGSSIVPAWQRVAVGDTVRAVPVGYAGGMMEKNPGWKVLARQEQRAFGIDYGTWTLTPLPGGRTRVVLRYRGPAFSWPMLAVDAGLGMPIHFLMGRRNLLGIAEHAIGVPYTSPLVELLATLGWALTALGAAMVLGRRERGWIWLLVALPWPALVLWTSSDWRSAAVAFLVVAGSASLAALTPRGWKLAGVLAGTAAVLVVLMLAPDGRVALGLIGLVGVPTLTAARLLRQRRLDCCQRVQLRSTEERAVEVALANEELDFGAARDDALRAALDQLGNDAQVLGA